MRIELQRDLNVTNKLFILIKGVEDFQEREFNITLKQATNLLIKCNHDFSLFVAELLCVKNGKIALRNLSTKVFDPNAGSYAQTGLLN